MVARPARACRRLTLDRHLSSIIPIDASRIMDSLGRYAWLESVSTKQPVPLVGQTAIRPSPILGACAHFWAYDADFAFQIKKIGGFQGTHRRRSSRTPSTFGFKEGAMQRNLRKGAV